MSKIESLIEAAKQSDSQEEDFRIVQELAKVRSRRSSVKLLVRFAKSAQIAEDDFAIVNSLKELSL